MSKDKLAHNHIIVAPALHARTLQLLTVFLELLFQLWSTVFPAPSFFFFFLPLFWRASHRQYALGDFMHYAVLIVTHPPTCQGENVPYNPSIAIAALRGPRAMAMFRGTSSSMISPAAPVSTDPLRLLGRESTAVHSTVPS